MSNMKFAANDNVNLTLMLSGHWVVVFKWYFGKTYGSVLNRITRLLGAKPGLMVSGLMLEKLNCWMKEKGERNPFEFTSEMGQICSISTVYQLY